MKSRSKEPLCPFGLPNHQIEHIAVARFENPPATLILDKEFEVVMHLGILE